MTTALKARLAGAMDGQIPIALIGVAAMGAIFAVNLLARPAPGGDPRTVTAPGCRECGTVVAIRRSAHSVPLTFVEIQMPDGSLRTMRGGAASFSVGDVVEVSGGAPVLRDAL